ncbi:MAG: double zinc ribbon domain-containing protein [Pirellulales bacterium]
MLAAKNNLQRWFAAGSRLQGPCHTAALDLLFPPACAGCHAELESSRPASFCDACLGRVEILRGAKCTKCGAPVPGGAPRQTCPRCGDVKLWFDETLALGEYEGLLREWLLRMKDDGGKSLTLNLAELLWREHAGRLAQFEANVVVPVPMHWRRRLQRGANAPVILAERLADHLRTPLATELLRRTRHTQPQFSVPPSRRRANVRNAFAVRAGYHFEGARVLLVDDILTTGSTASAAARTLKQAGAARVTVVVAARTLSH